MKRLLLILILLFPQIVAAGTYWVSPTGSASWATCESVADPGSNYCSYATANNNVSGGDTVYLKGGTYTVAGGNNYQQGIAPQASGTWGGSSCTSKITYQNAPGEEPVMVGETTSSTNYGIFLSGCECIKIDGITFQEIRTYARITSSSYNEITNCTFTSITTAGQIGDGIRLYSSCAPDYDCWNTHNWIHHNTIEKKRNGETCGEGTDLIRIGDDNSEFIAIADNNYNTVEANEIAYASHTPLDTYGNYTVIKNNFFHNEPWWTEDDSTCNYPNDMYDNESFDGKYGHRTLQITDGYERDAMYCLVEGNRSGFGSTNPGNNGANGIAVAGPRNIIRYNTIYSAMNVGLLFKYGYEYGTQGNGGIYNRVYNNTFYHCGYGNGAFYELNYDDCVAAGGGNCSTTPQALLAIRFAVSESIANVIKNNLIYDSRRYALSGFDIGYGASDPNSPDNSDCTASETPYPCCTGSGTGTCETILVNNWLTSTGNPNFVNTGLSDPTSSSTPDLALQSSSGAIDNGTYLTQANGSGSASTTLIVDDALYFQDGTWGSALATLHADWIGIGTVTNTVQISSINYGTNTITLSSAKTWADDAYIWLYKDSDGDIVLYGDAPDQGANEWFPTSNLRGVTLTGASFQ